ncbi:MAG: hypothetical protein A3E83_09015 [Gammaproteobacteria bacterium RIFCSPHIGHO2_12_FULL_41_20]|nr:MAG: hypothetical protein A3E83_09015 [Gammaproteobacteria bacterium RIFCSPHIGHO2_12_FULL_41_20]
MSKPTRKLQFLADGTVDTIAWLENIKTAHNLKDISTLEKSSEFTKKLTHGLTTLYGQPCIEFGLEVAETLLTLNLDQETASAAMLSSAIPTITPVYEELIKQQLGEPITKLINGVKQMDLISTTQQLALHNKTQIDKIRKMLLAMATDIRVVIIKLAEQLCFIRGIKTIPEEDRKRYAQTVLDIYAPLANRLGIGQLKWELEDLAFRYVDADTYKKIASFLAERRTDREKRIQNIVITLQKKLTAAHIKAEISGRAKHLYSIYLKTQRKDSDYQGIYDYSAVRVLVPTIEDCYTALSMVHSLWPPIMQEFDDYIAHPKPNGYRSIHTAVIDEDEKHFEIQIRTFAMHEEAERGVAAHWLYKEKQPVSVGDTEKISYLRQLLDWHKEIATTDMATNTKQSTSTDDQVYVITPAGEILDLPCGATPLDFAYHIHSQLGHRCRGAKINGQIVPLNYTLRTGDKIEITTILQGTPSRDWLNPELGYLKTNRARSKVVHWFKQQALNTDIAAGKQLLERELARSGLAKSISLTTIARHFNCKDEETLLVGLGRGNIRIGQILQAIQPKSSEKPAATISSFTTEPSRTHTSSAILGGADLLTRFAKCCKPIPGDNIIGYITYGRGISIHKKACKNMQKLTASPRCMDISWDMSKSAMFNTDLKIIAEEKSQILNEITSLFANEKIKLINFNSALSKNHNQLFISATVQVQHKEELQKLLRRIEQLPGVLEVSREMAS